MYAPDAVSEYQAFVVDVNDALQRLGSAESTTLLKNFNALIETDNKMWKGVIGIHGSPAQNKNGRYLLHLCCSNGLCVMNNFSQHRDIIKKRYRPSMNKKFMIVYDRLWHYLVRFVFGNVDVRVKRGAILSTDHHLAVCSLRISKSWPKKESHRHNVTYSSKWNKLAHKDVKIRFASSMTSMF